MMIFGTDTSDHSVWMLMPEGGQKVLDQNTEPKAGGSVCLMLREKLCISVHFMGSKQQWYQNPDKCGVNNPWQMCYWSRSSRVYKYQKCVGFYTISIDPSDSDLVDTAQSPTQMIVFWLLPLVKQLTPLKLIITVTL